MNKTYWWRRRRRSVATTTDAGGNQRRLGANRIIAQEGRQEIAVPLLVAVVLGRKLDRAHRGRRPVLAEVRELDADLCEMQTGNFFVELLDRT